MLHKFVLALVLVSLTVCAEDTVATHNGTLRGEVIKEDGDSVTIRVYSEVKVPREKIIKVTKDVPTVTDEKETFNRAPAPVSKAKFTLPPPAPSTSAPTAQQKFISESLALANKNQDKELQKLKWRDESNRLCAAAHAQQDFLKEHPDDAHAKAALKAVMNRLEEINAEIARSQEVKQIPPPEPPINDDDAKRVIERMDF